MNEDYLWDKSGEPDPQIQELEEILAPLRYQPKPLEIPAVRRRNYLPLAIAATILIALLVGGVWLRLRTEQVIPPQQAKSELPSLPSVYKVPEVVKNTDLPKKPVRQRINKPDREALAAKDQLMIALRLASEKLKSAQRMTQGASPNQIKNQHKVG
jgi:hypothetical protein